MKILVLALLTLTSVSHANPNPRIECHSFSGLSFAGLHVELVPDIYAPTATAYIQEYFGETTEIKNIEYKSIRGEGVHISGYEKNGLFKLLKSVIDGEDLGWALSMALGPIEIENAPMNCKIVTEIPAQSSLPF